jgi:hypothetical protein
MANLYELMGSYAALQQAMENDDLTDEALQQLLDAVDETKGSLREKVNGIVRVIDNLDSDIGRFEREEQRLNKRRTSMKNKKERLRAWVRNSMEILEVPRLKTDVRTLAIESGGKRVVVVDEKLVPKEYTRTTIEVDKKKVMKAYKDDGEIVAGCDIIDGASKLVIR